MSENTAKSIIKPTSISILHLIIAFILPALLYSLSVKAPFVYDDYRVVLHDAAVQNLDLLKIWQQPRSLHYTLISLLWHFFKDNPAPYHCANAFLLAMFSAACFLLFHRLSDHVSAKIALFAALLVSLNPLSSQATLHISQGSEILAALFTVLSLYCLFLARSDFENKAINKNFWSSYFGAFLFALFACFSKQNAAVLPILWASMEIFGFPSTKLSYLARIWFILPLLIGVILPLSTANPFPWFAMQVKAAIPQNSSSMVTVTPWAYRFTQLVVFWKYISLLCFPAKLSLEHEVVVQNSLAAPIVLFSGFGILAFLAVAWTIRYRFWLISAGIVIAVFGGIVTHVIPLEDMMVEHRMLIPLVGWGLIILGFGSILDDYKRKLIIPAFLLLAFYIASDLHRVWIWSDEIRLYADAAKKSPHLARPLNNLGAAYASRNDFSDAKKAFEKALIIDPQNAKALGNLARIHFENKDYEQAKQLYEKSLEYDANSADSWTGLGATFLRLQLFPQAFHAFNQCLIHRPKDPQCTKGLAILAYKSP